jgi:hypothetical protein
MAALSGRWATIRWSRDVNGGGKESSVNSSIGIREVQDGPVR